ncbi:TIGR04222 domain-containing membrane protein [Streptomyces sp. NPDC088915]|uniref:TIGR04222 domain-containing membrane protein n=1 Tax=Streptomyces sp. NPDC088915 TaxID=3365912 RepID=UPI00382E713A
MWWWLGSGTWVTVGVTTLGFWVSHFRLRAYRPLRTAPEDVTLGPYAYAYLGEGPRRTAQTALTALYRAGLITVVGERIVRVDAPASAATGTGSIDRDRDPGRTPDPVEAAALALCRPGRGAYGVKTERRVKRSGAVRRVGASLGEEGLLLHPGRAARRKEWEEAAIPAALTAVLLGEVALLVWSTGHRSDAGWVAALSPVLGVVSLASLRFARRPPERLTEMGRRLVEALPLRPSGADRALYEVAVQGTEADAMPQDLRRALRRPAPSAYRPDDSPGLGGGAL